jgi:hypothetical protein
VNAEPALLRLAGNEPLARGLMRHVYAHPHRDDVLVKVVRADAIEQRFRGARGWLRSRARARQYGVYLRELGEYVALRAREPVAAPIVRVYGLVETDLGLGQVVERLHGEDGGLAPTLERLVLRHGDAAWIRDGVERLFDDVLAFGVILSDMHVGNIVHGIGADGVPRFTLVDGFGEKNVVPLCSMSRRYRMHVVRKLQRKLHGQLQRLLATGSAYG